MLWIKTLHILFVMSWMAGLFYLPRIFVNWAEAKAAGEPLDRLTGMGRRLLRFTTILAHVAVAFGLILWLWYGIDGRWLHWKLVFVMALIAYHIACARMTRQMASGALAWTSRNLRIFNEGSVLLAFAIIALAVVKPG